MYCRCVEETEAHVHIYMWKIIYKHKDPRPMLSAQYMENHNDDDASSQNKGDTHRPRTRTISMAITPDQPGRTLQDNPLKVGVSYALVTVLPPVPIRQSKGLCMSCLPKGCPQDQAKGCLLSKPLPRFRTATHKFHLYFSWLPRPKVGLLCAPFHAPTRTTHTHMG